MNVKKKNGISSKVNIRHDDLNPVFTAEYSFGNIVLSIVLS